jgi:hypothetical protein
MPFFKTKRKMMIRAILVAWSALAASVAVDGRGSASDGTKGLLRGVEGAKRELQGTDLGLCIEVPNGEITPGSRLVAGTCDAPMNGFNVTDVPGTASVITFQSVRNSTMCVHVEPLLEGAFVRVRTCREDNMYQAFIFSKNNIKPIGDRTLCVANHGDTAEIDDFIVLKNCSEFANGWSFD